LHKNPALFFVGVLTAFLTAYYMGRECFVVFFGQPRWGHGVAQASVPVHHGTQAGTPVPPAHSHEPHESPLVMTLPLVFLAILSVVGGWHSAVPRFLDPHAEIEHSHLGYLLLAVPVVGFLLSWRIYWRPDPSDAPVKATLGRVWTWVENKYYFDELYSWIVKYVQGTIATLCELFDRWVLQRFGIGGLAGATSVAGRTLRLLQTGNIQSYAFLFGLGVTVIIYYVVVK
jgi:NADH-quinone oxidoreductase subunit L